MRAPLPLLAVPALAAVVAWCVANPPATAVVEEPASSEQVTMWRLKQVNERQYGTPVVRDALGVVTLRIDGGEFVEGAAGCRTFRAGYAVDRGAVLLTGLSVNESRCTAPVGRIDLVVSYLTEERFHARMSDDELTVTSVDGKHRLVFSALD